MHAKQCSWIVALALFAAVGHLRAQAPPDVSGRTEANSPAGPPSRAELETLRRTVAFQQEEIEQLKLALRRLAAPVASPAPNPAKASASSNSPEHPLPSLANAGTHPLEAGWNGRHFFLQSSDGSFLLEPYGYVQLDYRAYAGDATPPDTFALRRGRFGFEGRLGKHYRFALLADFADTKSALAREFSLDVNYLPALQFKFGQFKEPFSQEELAGAADIDFVERSLVRDVVPGYSPGVELHGQWLRDTIQYQLGAFNGRGFLKENDTSTPEGVFRLRFDPWRNTSHGWLERLAFGGAIASGRTQNGSSFAGVVQTGTFTFFKPETVNGKVVRANGEFAWTKGPFALRAEYDQASQQRAGLGPSASNLPGVVAKGYYLAATYLLTGETRPENGPVIPRHSFSLGSRQGLGAWELKFRYSNLQMADGLTSNRADQFSTGVNWYPTALVRAMLDFNVERLKNPVSNPVVLAPQSFLSVLERVQFRF